MRRIILGALLAVAVMLMQGSLTTPASAKTANPIFGSAKATLMSTDAAKQVTAKGGTTAAYLYYGLIYTSNAIYYAGLAQYYNYYGYNGSSGSTTNYAYYAYYNSYYATQYFYQAYYYSYYGY